MPYNKRRIIRKRRSDSGAFIVQKISKGLLDQIQHVNVSWQVALEINFETLRLKGLFGKVNYYGKSRP